MLANASSLLARVTSLAYNGPVDSPVTTSPKTTDNVKSAEQAPVLCVYTSLMGDYETLNEQPVARESKIPFVCFTDDPDLRSDTWQIRVVSPLFALDPARSQREFKLRPHIHLSEFDASLYIDNAVILTRPPERVFQRYGATTGFSLSRHSFRDSVLDEFLEVAKFGYDDPSRVFEQLNHYTLQHPEVLEERPYWGGILLRDHRNTDVRRMLDVWYANVMRYSRRDQLSLNAAFSQTGVQPSVMDIENHSSWFHTWPHAAKRDRMKGTLATPVSFSPPVALVRQLQLQLADALSQQEDLVQSEAWKVGNWLTEGADRRPLSVGLLLRALRKLSHRRKRS